jgi:3-hydroxyacyl-[acyl-carrier-protein] dehydratase
MRIEFFQLIDRVEAIRDDPPGLVAVAEVPADATIFQGHFPGYPVMPGVLLIESMAQAAGFYLLMKNAFSSMPFLFAVREAKLRRFVAPSSKLEIVTRLDHEGSGYAVSRTSISCAGKTVCSAELAMRYLPFPDPGLVRHLKERAAEIGLPELAAP